MTDETPDAVSVELDAQLRRLETIADPLARSIATDLLASVLRFHAAAIGHMLQAINEESDNTTSILGAFDRDPLIRSLLLLHDLHPDSLEVRVLRAIDNLQPRLQKRGATLELISADEDAVRVRVTANGESHGPVGPAVEQAIRNAAPEAAQVVIEEVGTAPRAGFVSIDVLQNTAPGDDRAGAIHK